MQKFALGKNPLRLLRVLPAPCRLNARVIQTPLWLAP
jgi:hypothetical protein